MTVRSSPGPRPEALRARVGIVLQAAGLYRHLTVREAVAHWAGLYPRPRDVDEEFLLDACEGHELAWFATQEIGDLLA